MKKMILSSAVAAIMASSAAMADVSVSGRFNVAYQDNDGAAEAEISSQGLNSSSRVTFDASDDLGNGMTAYMSTTMKYNVVGGSSPSNFYGWAGVKGDFGNVQIGKITNPRYALAEGYFDWARAVDVAGSGSKNDEAIRYSNKFGDVTFMAMIGMDGSTDDDSGIGIALPVGPVTVVATMEADSANTGGDGTDQTDIGVVYNDGPLSAGLAMITNDNGSSDTDIMVLQASYKMNNTKFIAQFTDVSNGVDVDSTVIGIHHGLSKKTTVYLENHSGDALNGGNDETAIGLITFF